MHRIVFLDAGLVTSPEVEEEVVDTEENPAPLRESGVNVASNAFNETVVSLVSQKLKPSGIIPLIVTPTGDEPDPLEARTDFANAAYNQAVEKYGRDGVSAVYVTIHYGGNASGEERGISYSVFESEGTDEAITANKIGNKILCRIMMDDQPNRGSIPNDFDVLVDTEMTSVLIQSIYEQERWDSVIQTNQDLMSEVATRITAGIFDFYEIPPEEQNPEKTYPEVVKGIYITGLVHVTADTAVIRERATNMAAIAGTFEKGHEFLMAGAFTGWYEVVHEEKRRYIKQQDGTPTFFPDR